MADAVSSADTGVHLLSPIELFQQADTTVKVVMVLLLLASAWAWGVIVAKTIQVTILNRRARALLQSLSHGVNLTELSEAFLQVKPDDPLRVVYQALVDENRRSADIRFTHQQQDSLLDRVHRVGHLATTNTLDRLKSGLPSLATVGAVSPFVGLFGTVWGIMNSFQGIAATNNTSLSVVAPGIAEALFATALGLFAAIPAVIFYNRITGDIAQFGRSLKTFIEIYGLELSRQLSKGEPHGRIAA